MRSRTTSRKGLCPCKSGLQFKECHGKPQVPLQWILLVGASAITMIALFFSLGAPPKGSNGNAAAGPKVTTYATLPGLDLDQLDPSARYQLVSYLNQTTCVCDCKFTIAECRNIHSTCRHSAALAQASYDELIPKATDPGPEAPQDSL